MMRLLLLLSFSLTSVFCIESSPVQGGVFNHRFSCDGSEEVRFDNKKIFVLKNGDKCQALIGIPLEEKAGKKKLEIISGKKQKSVDFDVKHQKYQEQYITLKSDKRVELSDENLKRYEKEKEEIKKILSEKSKIKIDDFSFKMPVEGRISSTYGLKRFYNNKPRSPHKGIDIAAKKGTEIHALHDGKIIGIGDYFFNGKTIFLDHGGGFISMYCHMDGFAKKEGEMIKKGDVIGYVGSTGRSTAPHLHFGIYLNDTWINPLLLVKGKV